MVNASRAAWLISAGGGMVCAAAGAAFIAVVRSSAKIASLYCHLKGCRTPATLSIQFSLHVFDQGNMRVHAAQITVHRAEAKMRAAEVAPALRGVGDGLWFSDLHVHKLAAKRRLAAPDVL
jgi:hypothetical protein